MNKIDEIARWNIKKPAESWNPTRKKFLCVYCDRMLITVNEKFCDGKKSIFGKKLCPQSIRHIHCNCVFCGGEWIELSRDEVINKTEEVIIKILKILGENKLNKNELEEIMNFLKTKEVLET
jgi:hypothetical protein